MTSKHGLTASIPMNSKKKKKKSLNLLASDEYLTPKSMHSICLHCVKVWGKKKKLLCY